MKLAGFFNKKGQGNAREVRQHVVPGRQIGSAGSASRYIFRRSRTLTGSAANDVKTVVAVGASLQSERLRLHELHQRRRMLLGLACASVVAAFGVWYLLASTITGAHVVADDQSVAQADEQKIMQAIQRYVNNNPTEAFAMSLNHERFSNFMRQVQPDIKTISLQSSWLGIERRFQISYRQALAAWQIGGQQFYIDAEGVAFTTLHGAAPSLKVEDTSGYAPQDGSSVASKRFIRYLGQLLSAVTEKQLGAIERVMLPASTRELDLFLKDRPYPIKTHVDRDPYQQADDIQSALGFLDEKKIKPEYLDVRVKGKAFYK